MNILKVVGYKTGASRFTAPGGRFQCEETIIVKVDDPRMSAAKLVSLLPVFGAPGTTDWNPKQLTFTFFQSRHPDNNLLYLDDVGSIKTVNEEGGYWFYVPLTYRQPPITQLSPANQPKEERRDQKVSSPEVNDPVLNTPITNPVNRPDIYGRTSRLGEKDTYRKPDGSVIKHANGMPIREPVKVPSVDVIHTFSWNKAWSALNLDTIKGMEGKINSTAINRGKLTGPIGNFRIESIVVSEEYESPPQSTTVFHYARLTMTLVESPLGWEMKIPSMHTLQKNAAGDKLVAIPVNARGDLAKVPWPLKTDGTAIPFAAVAAGNLTGLAFLDTGYPETADIQQFMVDNGLSV